MLKEECGTLEDACGIGEDVTCKLRPEQMRKHILDRAQFLKALRLEETLMHLWSWKGACRPGALRWAGQEQAGP